MCFLWELPALAFPSAISLNHCNPMMFNNNRVVVYPFLRFINVAFLIMPGAALVFDMPATVFGPNDVSRDLVTSRNLRGFIRVRRSRAYYIYKGNHYSVCMTVTLSNGLLDTTAEASVFLLCFL